MERKEILRAARQPLPAALLCLAAAFLVTAGCSSDERAWRKARQADTLFSYAAYAAASPKGKHVDEAFRIMEDMRRKGTADGIFENLVKTYDERFKLSGTPYTVLERTAAEHAEKPAAVPPPPPPPPAGTPIQRARLIAHPGMIPGLVLTALPDGAFRLNRSDVAPDGLDVRLKDVFEARVDKTLFFRFLRPVKDYREIVDFTDRLIKAGIENPVPIITPQIQDIVWKEFGGAVSLPILDEKIASGDEGILDPREAAGEVPEETTVVEGGVVGGVVGGVPEGIPGGVPGGVAGGGDKAEIVRNPKVPIQRDLLAREEEVVIPQPGGPPESLLAGVGTIVVDQKGWIYIADNKDQRVKIYDPNGGFVRVIGRVGQGPGEYQELSWIFLTSGGELGLHDFQRQQVHFFLPDGRYLRSLQVPRKPNTGGGRGLQVDGRDVFFSYSQASDPASMLSWQEAARMGKALADDDILEKVELSTVKDAMAKRVIIRGRPVGGVIIGHSWEYLFKFYDSAGRLEKEVSRGFDPVSSSQEESDYWYKSNKSRPTQLRPFSDFVVDDRDWLIVKTSKRTAGRKEQFFDVFDWRGRFQAQMTLPTRDYLNDLYGWALFDPFYVKNGRIYIVAEDGEGNLIVRRYAVTWPLGIV